MNTEINLLEKKHNQYIVPLLFSLFFLIGLIIVWGLLYFQYQSLSRDIEQGNNDITEMELSLAQQQSTFAPKEKRERIELEIERINNDKIPQVSLYKNVLRQLPTQESLIYYEFSGEDNFVISGEFKKVENIASYLAKLLDEEYIMDSDLTQITYNDPKYDALVTFTLDIEVLREEFGEN